MSFVVSIVTVCPMRKEPSHRSEMVSQLLFGEFAEVLESDKDFTRVKCLYDGYEGWCQRSQLERVDSITEPRGYLLTNSSHLLVGHLNIPVLFGSPIFEQELRLGTIDVRHILAPDFIWELRADGSRPVGLGTIARRFLGTPYLWGGKSLSGIDCSGFVQQVFKFFEVSLLRDAYLQAGQGTEVDFGEIKFGDLAFFKNENEKITHVGIIVKGNRIIHASGMVRLDHLREDGIYRSDTGEKTHVMHSVRRVAVVQSYPLI